MKIFEKMLERRLRKLITVNNRWRPKGYADTADHPGGCAGQNILEIKNSGR